MSAPSPSELRRRLATVSLADERRLGRRLDRLRGPKATPATLTALAHELDAAESRLAARADAVPAVTYPPQLPVSERRDEIAAAIAEHQVVVVAGETGSGKTTQLPKICLELGRGRRGRIGHTQPRRIAARSVAKRIADELSVPLGAAVGFAVRFADETSEATSVKVMTDGILLAEIQRDPNLLQYDTIIIDEAHERSLTIDFLLGYLRQLLPRRPDLKLVITSATIDPQRFADHFGGAPVIEVSGRTYPVEVRYRPLSEDVATDEDDDDLDESPRPESTRQPHRLTRQPHRLTRQPNGSTRQPRETKDQVDGITEAVTELWTEGPGDILVFLSGEREIRDTADALTGMQLVDTEILPLYARLSTAEQQRVFAPHRQRRIVLATNVAETSLTVPGIKYVVDPGTARISRYSTRTKVQRLPIERISQASAQQRAGRCGRTSDGVCIRLYSEEDFESRPLFTEPEILRTNLASVILSMTSLGLGDVASFGFLDPPDRTALRDGMTLLTELGALDSGTGRDPDGTQKLSATGRSLAQLPVDPRIGRMILAAADLGCVREVLVVAAALSIQDPREHPAEQREKSDELHRRFADEYSDFAAYLNLWRYLREQQKALSGNQFRRRCRDEFLHYLRVREWQDLVSQLRRTAAELKIVQNSAPADEAAVHEALLTGLLSNVGTLAIEKRSDARTGMQRREYVGARNTRFVIGSGSSLASRPPRWVVAAELVETSRLFARTVARVDPAVIERLAGHLVVRSYSEPRWDERRGAAVCSERVTLYGLTLAAGRTAQLSRTDPALARELFIRHALVGGEWTTHHDFDRANRDALDRVAELARRTRRPEVVLDEEAMVDFFDRRLPADVVSVRHFDRWWRDERGRRPGLLTYPPELLRAPDVDAQDFPDEMQVGDLRLRVAYAFDPGRPADGVTVHVPLEVLNRVGLGGLDRQVPGLREELVAALLKSLRKDRRRLLGPAPDRARAVLAALPDDDPRPLLDALEDELEAQTSVRVNREDWRLDRVPDHLRVRFAVDGPDGRTVATGTDLGELRDRLAVPLADAVSAAAPDVERSGLTSWDFDVVDRSVSVERDGHRVQGFPALVDNGDSVSLRVLPDADAQAVAMPAGVARLLLLDAPKVSFNGLAPRQRLLLGANPDGSLADLVADASRAVVLDQIARLGVPWDRTAYEAVRHSVRTELPAAVFRMLGQVGDVLAAIIDVHTELDRLSGVASAATARADVTAQLDRLLAPGFVTAAGVGRVRDLPRYLAAAARRLSRLPQDVEVDAVRAGRIVAVADVIADARARLGDTPAVRDLTWLLEELRVSLFAQELGTAGPVSEKRILRAVDSL